MMFSMYIDFAIYMINTYYDNSWILILIEIVFNGKSYTWKKGGALVDYLVHQSNIVVFSTFEGCM
jgi:hypothetical protein